MADTIDSLQIEINAKATKANDAIDRLVGKLDRLTTSLSRVNGTNLNGLANGVQRLGNAMQVMNTIKTADFTRLATNLTKLGTVNVSALNSAASSMSHLTRAFNSLGTVSANAQSVGEMAKNIAKLGNKSVQTAITNIPRLATALNNLMITLSKSPKVSQNVIQMTNALANLANQGSKVGSASNGIVRGLNRTSASANTAKKSFGGLASAIGKFYATYFMVIRGLKGLWSSIKGTADYIEAYNYFNVALGKIGSDWSHQFEKYGYDNAESYAESFKTKLSDSLGKLSGVQVSIGADGKGLLTESGMKNLGLNIQEITQYASQLASVTNSVGQTGEVSLAVASSFTKLAGDISSLFNVDYSSVSKNLQSGLIGQSRALYKYGIDITNATLQTYAYNLGLSKSVSEMTQAEKMQLRMLAILDQSKVSWGDLANTINSPSNMIRQFKNNLKEAGTVLGQLFIPVLQKVLPVINGVAIAIKRLLVDIAGLLGIKIDFDSFGQGYSNIEDELDTSADAFENATQKAEEYKNQLLGFDEVEKVSEPTDKSNASANTSNPIDLTKDILKATSEYEEAWEKAYEKMQSRSEEFANAISKALKPISTIFEDIAKGDWLKLGKDTSKLVTDIFNFFSSAIKKVNWTKLGKSIGLFLAGVEWYEILKSALKLKLDIGRALAEVWFGSFDTAPIETSVITALATLKFTGLGKLLSSKIATAITGSAFVVALKKSLKKYETPIIGYAITLLVSAISIKVAKNKLAPIFKKNDLKDIKKASEKMFADWFGKNKFSLTLSDMFVFTSTAIAEPKEIISAFKKLWKDICSGDFKFNLFNLIEFPSVNELSPALKQMLSDIKNGDFKFSFLNLFEFPSFNELKDALSAMWSDIKSGDFKLSLPFGFQLPTVNEIKKGIKNTWNNIKSYAENLVVKIGKINLPSFDNVKNAFSNLKDTIQKPFINIVKWFVGKFSNISSSISNAINIGNIKNTFSSVWSAVKSPFANGGKWFHKTFLSFAGKITNAFSPLKQWFSTLFIGIKEVIKAPLNLVIGFLNSVIKGVETAINFAIKGLNKLSFKVPDWVPGIGGESWGFDIKEVKFDAVPKLANGGFVEQGQLFVAREAGPELVGTMNGNTAVANNDQIVAGISSGVYPAVYNAVVQAMSGIKGGSNGDIVIQIDGKEVFKAVQKQADNYTMQNSKPAFMI